MVNFDNFASRQDLRPPIHGHFSHRVLHSLTCLVESVFLLRVDVEIHSGLDVSTKHDRSWSFSSSGMGSTLIVQQKVTEVLL